MVDFQSRDTRRRMDDEDEEDDEEQEAEQQDEPAEDEGIEEETTDGSEPATAEEPETVPEAFSYAVVTVADGQTVEGDATGGVVVDAVEQAGDAVSVREILAQSYDGVQQSLQTLADRRDVDAIVTLGGVGVAPGDVTVDAAEDLFDTHLPGFGELFRVLSHDQEGTAIVRDRSTAGLIDGVPVFCLPADSIAARRGVEQIVLAEAPELADLASAADEA